MFGNGGLAMMKMVVMMMMTIWTDRSPICALFPGVLRGLLTDYQWEGVDPRHPNTSNNSSATFTLSTSTPHLWIFLAFFVCGYIFDYFWVNIDWKRHLNCSNNSSFAFPLYNCQHQHLIRVISQRHRTYYSNVERFKRQPHQYYIQDLNSQRHKKQKLEMSARQGFWLRYTLAEVAEVIRVKEKYDKKNKVLGQTLLGDVLCQ